MDIKKSPFQIYYNVDIDDNLSYELLKFEIDIRNLLNDMNSKGIECLNIDPDVFIIPNYPNSNELRKDTEIQEKNCILANAAYIFYLSSKTFSQFKNKYKYINFNSLFHNIMILSINNLLDNFYEFDERFGLYINKIRFKDILLSKEDIRELEDDLLLTLDSIYLKLKKLDEKDQILFINQLEISLELKEKFYFHLKCNNIDKFKKFCIKNDISLFKYVNSLKLNSVLQILKKSKINNDEDYVRKLKYILNYGNILLPKDIHEFIEDLLEQEDYIDSDPRNFYQLIYSSLVIYIKLFKFYLNSHKDNNALKLINDFCKENDLVRMIYESLDERSLQDVLLEGDLYIGPSLFFYEKYYKVGVSKPKKMYKCTSEYYKNFNCDSKYFSKLFDFIASYKFINDSTLNKEIFLYRLTSDYYPENIKIEEIPQIEWTSTKADLIQFIHYYFKSNNDRVDWKKAMKFFHITNGDKFKKGEGPTNFIKYKKPKIYEHLLNFDQEYNKNTLLI